VYALADPRECLGALTSAFTVRESVSEMQTRLDPLTRALQEILDSVVTEAARDALLKEALALGSLAELPPTSAELLDFIDGPLLLTLERALGQELGRSVADELERWIGPLSTRRGPIAASPCVAVTEPPRVAQPALLDSVARAEFGRRATLPATVRGALSDPTPPASGDYPHGMAQALGLSSAHPPASELSAGRALPLVFVATRDADLVTRFMEWIEPDAVVVRMTRLVDLLLDIEDAGARRVVIVIDCARSPLRLEAFAAIAEELPQSARVVLWGSSAEAVRRMCQISPAVARWISVPSEAPLADLVERCAALVG